MNRAIVSTVACLGMLFLAGCNLETYESEATYTLDATELETFVIQQESGDVSITGDDQINEITVVASGVAQSEEASLAKKFSEEQLEVSLTSEGTTGLLTTKVNSGEVGKEEGNVNLEISMPSHLKLDYRQNEGQLNVSSMKEDLSVQHGTKSVTFEDIEGNIQIVDGSGGGLTLRNVIGNVSINKSSSTTSISELTGELTVIAGSGDVEVENQQGNVSIRSGTGNVYVHNADGDVAVLANRDGTLELTDITGTVTKPE